jgi:S-DNA-T family DNA segregation ATPase FtsK/SpoIIIE
MTVTNGHAPIENLVTPEKVDAETIVKPVAPAEKKTPAAADARPLWQRQPVPEKAIVPPWLRKAEQRAQALKWARGYAWHASRFHLLRLPKYALRTAVYTLRGSYRSLRTWLKWQLAHDAHELRVNAVVSKASGEYLSLHRHRSEQLRARAWGAGTCAGLGGIALAVAATLWPPTLILAAALAAAALLWQGRPTEGPFLVDSVITPNKVTRLTQSIVTRALGAIGNTLINAVLRKEENLTFVAPVIRDGPGWRAELDLPYGVTVTDILEKREELASGLRRPLGCVWPEPVHDEHPGRLVLWVGDQALSSIAPVPWPWTKAGKADYFAPIPFGNDPRGRAVKVGLFENNILIGAIPGAGKTATMRVLMLGAALDPSAELWVGEFKGNGDLDSAEYVAHRYVSGCDDESIATGLRWLRDLKAEIMRRVEVMSKLPKQDKPDGKVTRRLADSKKLGLHPLVVVFDEVQNLFADPTHGKEAGETAEYCIKLARALAVTIILATQRPDKDSVPTGVSANVSVRFCLRVMGQTENDMILGTSSYKNGLRATTFTKADRGVGYLVGATDDPVIVKGNYIDTVAAETIAQRARTLREDAGRLDGYALNNENAKTERGIGTLLDDILTVVTEAEPQIWSETVAERLADLRPEVYGGWTAVQVNAALRPHGIQISRQVWSEGVNRRGFARDDIAKSVTQRDEKA